MFTSTNYSDNYDREKLRILQSLNSQVQTMVVKLDQIVTQTEENIFRLKSSPNSSNSLSRSTLANLNGSLEKQQPMQVVTNNTTTANNTTINTTTVNTTTPNNSVNNSSSKKNANSNSKISKVTKLNGKTNKRPKSIANLSKSFEDSQQSHASTNNLESELKQQSQSHASLNKRNKQQRIFNTFVRDSINQLLGPDYMRTHDVQDIDPQVMEMIRKEAVQNYLPENIRPRRAWHLAKASLRTLKRTLNNKTTTK